MDKGKRARTKLVDEIIRKAANNEMIKLEEMADIKQYKEQIQNRKQEINEIFNDFDHNMKNIEMKHNKNSLPINSTMTSEKALDKIIKRRISQAIKKIYNYYLEKTGESDTKSYEEIYTQIIDRQLRISWLLDNWESHKDILKQQYVENEDMEL